MAQTPSETTPGHKERPREVNTDADLAETPIFVVRGVMKEAFPDTGFVEEHDEAEGTFVPQGALTFVMLMLSGYVIYWAYVWLIIIERR
ncbi:MAG: hypothetical protein HC884_12305 [Chloroflexaceae bacterium]|nr:hypothetical protein [Chloroflexaceae bacterium]